MILHGSDRPDLLIVETLPDILEATILRHPDAVAIHWQDQSITYETLGRRADLAAHHLIEAGVRPGDIVGLCLPRGDELLLMQAAIAAGAAWLPFESDTRPSACRPACRTPAQYIVAGGEVQLDGIATCTPWQLSQPAADSAPLRGGAAARASGLRHLHLRFHRQAQGRAHHPGQHLPLPAQRERSAGRVPRRQGLPGLLGGL